MVASSGGWNWLVSGSRLIPSSARTCGGASATHSPTAASDCAPASTAATDASNNDVSVCRTPCGSRGSGTCGRHPVRPGHSLAHGRRPPAERPRSCSRAGLIGDDDKAGTVSQK
jgi:hypothetical protein